MRVEHTSYGKRILNSFVGLVIGILLFLGSFIVLFVNEGRENLAKYAKEAIVYESGGSFSVDQPVYIVGSLNATNYAQDSFLKPGNYIYLERQVEMYAYVEHEHSETKENVGGSSTTTYTYSYELTWTSSPKVASNFKGDSNEIPANIPSSYDSWINSLPEDQASKASGLSINGINVSSSELTLSGEKILTLSNELVNTESLSANESVSGGLIYRQNSQTGTINQPGVGDVRITYKAITNSDNGVLMGSFENNSFVSFMTDKDNTLYRFFAGVDTKNHAVNILQDEYKTALWMFRLIGFLMMFIGLLLFANPIMTLLSVIPIFAKIGRFVYGIVAFIISLTLTGLTILLGIILHNIYLAALFIIIVIGIIILILKKKLSKSKEHDTTSKTKKRK